MPKAKPTAQKPEDATAVSVGEHSRYQVKSGWLAGRFVARAFPKPPTDVRGMIAEATGASEEEAIASLHAIIDSKEAQRIEERRVDKQTGFSVPSIEEYAEAITQVALSQPQRAMLAALALSGDVGLSESRLTSEAGYKSQTWANRTLASVGLLVASCLSLEAPTESENRQPKGTTILGYRGEQRNADDPGNLILHSELRNAVLNVW